MPALTLTTIKTHPPVVLTKNPNESIPITNHLLMVGVHLGWVHNSLLPVFLQYGSLPWKLTSQQTYTKRMQLLYRLHPSKFPERKTNCQREKVPLLHVSLPLRKPNDNENTDVSCVQKFWTVPTY